MTAVAGAAAVRSGLAPTTGLVAEHPDLRHAGLAPLDALVFGGHDVTSTPLRKRAEQLAAGGVLPGGLPELVAADLDAAEREVRPGVGPAPAVGEAPADAVRRLAADLEGFRGRLGLERVVVVNVSSTEPPLPPRPEHATWAELGAALERGEEALPPSALYACAAFQAGCSFVDFTPSTGARLPALEELAATRGVPWAGSDGKTGETLLKSVLGPMFATRRLAVRAWSGTNLLGGGDGATLADPANAAGKLASKQRVLAGTLGEPVDGEVHIDHVAALGEWKTAWDHVLFEGFLGVGMTLQFTWQGCDSALAAPLVLDLARFTARAHEVGMTGPLGELGFFFKDPVGDGGHGLHEQYLALRGLADRLAAPEAGR
ncbi:myo-inositol-1-phosphate synthase [Allostreptomyces psammosilenae]|uniref:Myo-inositol-1-phosphate synthase n=1 Tax=Allostreptomyces psammosilenae TaxID=1892865 RepID=A0A852ZSR0_9ACTN|nr:myo-inositol-1-phosphate synthase [Allostreptomyces psammosilenae]